MVSLGLASMASLGGPFFRTLRQLGYSGVDLQCDSDIGYMRAFEIDRFKDWLAGADLRVSCVSNVHDVELASSSSAAARGAAARHADRTIRLAANLDVRFVRLYFGCSNLGSMFYQSGRENEWQEEVRETTSRALPLIQGACDRGLRVLIEPHPRQSLFTLGDLDLFSQVLRAQGLVFGVAFDPANIVAGGLDPIAYLEALGPPDLVHLKDVEVFHGPRPPAGPGWKRYGPGPFIRFRRFGAGGMDWDQIAVCLGRSGFDGPFIVELEDPTVPAVECLASAGHSARAFVEAYRETRARR